jgi:hypothetical protein
MVDSSVRSIIVRNTQRVPPTHAQLEGGIENRPNSEARVLAVTAVTTVLRLAGVVPQECHASAGLRRAALHSV